MTEQSIDFKHILITRFNLNLGWRDKSGNETLTDSWMSERFRLFEQFCVPSILNQSAKNFEWLVLFDLSAQLRYGKKIDEYSSGIPFFIPVFLSHPVDNEEIKLTKTELNILSLFMEKPGKIFSRDNIINSVRGHDVFVVDRTIDVHIMNLRKKLGDYKNIITTFSGVGYGFKE